ncbi:MAG: sigma-70 family RNA polymerase sigma factor [Candidatus Limnocylindrales bacterium]
MAETETERIAAFQRLADERLDASYRLANAILGDEAQSQDAVHDAFVQAWQRWPSLRDRSKFSAWFDRIVVNTCRNHLRGARYRHSTDLVDAHLTTPDASAEVHRRMLVEEALGRLKPDDVVVLALRHFLDLQLDDIATLLDIPLPTAKTRLRTARLRLRDQLDRQTPREVTP